MSETPVKYRIVDYRTINSYLPDRRGKKDTQISYYLEDTGIDYVTIPEEEANEAKAKEAIEAQIRRKLQFIGLKGEVARV